MLTSQAGLSLIKEFEGLRLTSYYCASGVLTIGWGHTGPDVYEGQSITEDRAEDLLRGDLRRFEDAVTTLIDVSLTQNQFDALVSFAFNCGTGALADSTLRKRLNAGEDICLVLGQELPKWVNGPSGPLPGLVRRREAEVDHACKGITPIKEEPVVDEFILNAVKYYNGEAHQQEAFLWLWSQLGGEQQERFVKAYRNELVEESKGKFPLDVPYFYQRDSKTGHGERMCFSSSMAMALDYIDPDGIQGDDDWYLQQVFKFGDSVSADAQVQAAEYLGYEAQFRTDGSEQDLIELLDTGTPIPIGILHKGPISAPSGGGHWICLIGYDDKYFHVHDPFGQLDLVGGNYTIDNGPTAGENQRYSRENLMKRWLIANDHDGWMMVLS